MRFQDTWEMARRSFLQVSFGWRGYLRPENLAQATATSESALAFDLGKRGELLPRAAREIHLKM